MKHITNIRGNGIPNIVQILNNQVFVASNVHEYEEEIEGQVSAGYEYDCDVYSKDEYILLMAEKTSSLQDELSAAKILLGVDE